jgi:hypothetical protein
LIAPLANSVAVSARIPAWMILFTSQRPSSFDPFFLNLVKRIYGWGASLLLRRFRSA